MIFLVDRTSKWGDGKPCKEARRIKIERWDTRTLSEKAYNREVQGLGGGSKWREIGKNHRTIKNGKWITRQIEDTKEWAIEIDSLEELMKFISKYGRIIISDYYSAGPEKNPKIHAIEIYDDRRE
jgi:hypothetical protein